MKRSLPISCHFNSLIFMEFEHRVLSWKREEETRRMEVYGQTLTWVTQKIGKMGDKDYEIEEVSPESEEKDSKLKIYNKISR